MSTEFDGCVYLVSDNKFLTVVDNTRLTFTSDHSINAMFKIIDADQGCVRIICLGNKKFWKLNRSNNFVLADGDILPPTIDTLFRSVDDSDCKVFQSVANNKFCSCPSDKNVLMATATSMDDAVKLKAVPVLNVN